MRLYRNAAQVEYLDSAWDVRYTSELTYTIMEQEEIPPAVPVLPEDEDTPVALAVPPPPANKTDWDARADKIKAVTIKASKIVSIVTACIALLELIYVGVLYLL